MHNFKYLLLYDWGPLRFNTLTNKLSNWDQPLDVSELSSVKTEVRKHSDVVTLKNLGLHNTVMAINTDIRGNQIIFRNRTEDLFLWFELSDANQSVIVIHVCKRLHPQTRDSDVSEE